MWTCRVPQSFEFDSLKWWKVFCTRQLSRSLCLPGTFSDCFSERRLNVDWRVDTCRCFRGRNITHGIGECDICLHQNCFQKKHDSFCGEGVTSPVKYRWIMEKYQCAVLTLFWRFTLLEPRSINKFFSNTVDYLLFLLLRIKCSHFAVAICSVHNHEMTWYTIVIESFPMCLVWSMKA